jgi:hypothetical protein
MPDVCESAGKRTDRRFRTQVGTPAAICAQKDGSAGFLLDWRSPDDRGIVNRRAHPVNCGARVATAEREPLQCCNTPICQPRPPLAAETQES